MQQPPLLLQPRRAPTPPRAALLPLPSPLAHAPPTPAGAGGGDDDEQQQQLDWAALAAAIRDHPSTDAEVTALCGDLQVLGRSEFKQLLRWRLGLRRELKAQLGLSSDEAKAGGHKKRAKEGEGAAAAADGEAEGEGADPEAKLLGEMAAIREAAEQR